jgi:anti-anti-sigma regulatory factor
MSASSSFIAKNLLNLGEVAYIDSSGIGVLVAAKG